MKNPHSAGPLLAALIMMAGSAASAEEAPQAPAAGITVRQLAGARIVEAVLPGSAVDVVVAPAVGLAVLVAAEDDADGPLSLYRFDPAGEGSLVELARDLPPELDAIACLDLDGDGRREILAGAPGKLLSLGALDDPATGRRPRMLLEAAGLDLGRLRRRGLIAPDRPPGARPSQPEARVPGALVPVPALGSLDLYRWNGKSAMELATSVELPVRARRLRTGLELSTPTVHILKRQDDLPLFAAGPEPQGKRRLLTTLVDPGRHAEAAEGVSTEGEIWARLPANERVAQSWYLDIDTLPMLAVAVLSADKLGIFEKKKLRIFPLRSDRTRAGSPPALALETATRNWYDLGVHVADLDLDGRDDLIVIQPDGLDAKKLAVEAYRGKGTGGFFLTPRRSVIVAQHARWTFGSDLDGDRVPDLAAVAGGRLLVFRGLATHKRLVIEKKPHWSFDAADLGEIPDLEVVVHLGGDGESDEERESDEDSDSDSDGPALGRPLIADLDGDGRGEIVLRGEIGGRALIRVIELR